MPRGWGENTTIYLSPRAPNNDQNLRLIITSYDEPMPNQLTLIDPKGRRVQPELKRSGGPPWGYVATIPAPSVGEWMATYGDGAERKACRSFKVVPKAPLVGKCSTSDDPEAENPDPVWRPNRAWGPRTESFYATFVEHLFDYPVDEDLTWPNLTELLNDSDRNILHNHFSRKEEARIRLKPDCADLPYFLTCLLCVENGPTIRLSDLQPGHSDGGAKVRRGAIELDGLRERPLREIV